MTEYLRKDKSVEKNGCEHDMSGFDPSWGLFICSLCGVTSEDLWKAKLLERAESYSRDGAMLRQDGDTLHAPIYEMIASELRKVVGDA
jgi:hypothetical protein